MKCFYHTDLDGRGSAYWIRKIFRLEKFRGYGPAEFIPINYNKKIDLEHIELNEDVFIVDFSIPVDDMRKLTKITNNIVWIDHHKTAIDDYAGTEFERLAGIRSTEYSGAVLSWKYYIACLCNGREEGMPIGSADYENAPYFTKLIDDHDRWQFKFPDTKAFQIFMDTFEDQFAEGSEWFKSEFNIEEMHPIIDYGRNLLKYKDKSDINDAKYGSFTVLFEGIRFLAINKSGNSSVLEKTFNPEMHEAMMLFHMGKDRKFKVSLFGHPSHDIDLSVVAKKHGGGGHRNACGFYIDDIRKIID